MKSKLLEAYKLLGLEVGDEIKVDGRDKTYVVLNDGIAEKGWDGMRFKSLLAELLGGEYEFVKISKPLKECTTIELINELINRPGVEHLMREGRIEPVEANGMTVGICRSDVIHIWHEAERGSE